MNRLTALLALFTLLLFPAAPVVAQEESPPRIAILPLELHAPQEMGYLRDGIRTMLGSRLAAGRQATLLDRATVEQALAAGDPPSRPGDFARLGRRLEADYLIGGVLTAVGGGLSLDLNVYDVQEAGTAHGFFASAVSEEEVIPRVNELAREIHETLFTPAPAPALGAAAPPAPAPPAPGDQQPSYVSPHPERQLYGEMGGSAAPFIRPTDISWLRGYSKSHDIPMALQAMDVADVTGDGEMEFILAATNRVEIYRRELGRFIRLGRIDTLNRYPIHYVSTADLNGNGRAEIYLSAADHDTPNSLIVEWDGEQFVRTHDNLPWYIRAMHLPMEGQTLVGQQGDAGSFLRPGLFRLHPAANGALEEGSPLSLPGRLALFDFIYADLNGDGAEEIIAITQGERLEVLSPGGGRLWRSDHYYGGTTRYLGGQDIMESEPPLPHEISQHYVPARIVARDINQNGLPEVVVIQNHRTLPTRTIGRVRYYSSGEIHALSWDGSGMTQIWRTRKIDGYLPDLQFGPEIEITDEEGQTRRGSELYVGVTRGGAGFNILSGAESAIYIYPVEYQEEGARDTDFD